MIDLLSSTQIVLREAGYDVRLANLDRTSFLSFEDGAVIGFCHIFESAADLLLQWKDVETKLLMRFAHDFRTAGDKAWNVYCVFLSGSPATDVQEREVGWIEEDLERTRKITGCGIENRRDLTTALLPVLPIQYQPLLPNSDVAERLKRRISSISPEVADIALDDQVPPTEVVRRMGVR